MSQDYSSEIAGLHVLLKYVGFHPKGRAACESAIAALQEAAVTIRELREALAAQEKVQP